MSVIRHLAFEDLGLFAAPLEARGWTIRIVDAGIDDIADAIADADLAVICGGPIGVYESDRYPFLLDELAAIERRVEAGLPTLGLCLGAQLIAAALGAPVYPGRRKEIGWGRIQLTIDGRESCLAAVAETPVLHWHGDTFDLPPGAALLASSDTYPHQAFAIGAHTLALQFHAEADPRRIEQWLIGHAAELSASGVDVPGLRQRTAAVRDAVEAAAPDLLNRWIEGWR
ncbi:glutamine amidotransferase [Iodidimonas sp. SYSU 1G8]|uniref:glutamine amidotransferase n=1 Tax=Iodidimonas sp. SYSU 1G8 TaxID=3133967 RepID=UPI0031FF06AA